LAKKPSLAQMLTNQRHSLIVQNYINAKNNREDMWCNLHIYLHQRCFKPVKPDSKENINFLFAKYPFVIQIVSKLEWGNGLTKEQKYLRSGRIRKTLYSQAKKLKAKERQLKNAVANSTRFNSFSYIIWRSKSINLQFTRERILSYL